MYRYVKGMRDEERKKRDTTRGDKEIQTELYCDRERLRETT